MTDRCYTTMTDRIALNSESHNHDGQDFVATLYNHDGQDQPCEHHIIVKIFMILSVMVV